MTHWAKRFALVIPLLTLICMSSPSSAGELQLGAKVGYFDLDFDTRTDETEFLSVGVQIGYEYFTSNSMAFSADFEFTSSLTEGEANTEDYSYQSIGAFASLRTRGNTFFIGRVGFVSAEADFEDTATVDDDGSVIGVGIGFGKETRREIILDTIQYSEDHSAVTLSFGLRF